MGPGTTSSRRTEFIGKHLDVTGTRLKDDDAKVLCDYIENFRPTTNEGQSETRMLTPPH